MEEPVMEQEENGGGDLSALGRLGRHAVYSKPFGGKLFQLEYPDEIKKTEDDILEPVDPHHGGKITVFFYREILPRPVFESFLIQP